MNEGDLNTESQFSTERYEGNNEGLIKLVLAIFVMLGIFYWIFTDVDTSSFPEVTKEDFIEESLKPTTNEEQVAEIPEEKEESTVAIVEKEESMEFYFNRALKREKEKDFNGALEDYERTIKKAKKYSVEMWKALNNGGIIKAQQFKNYKGALKDFNTIIKIENNRYDGEMNATRLESGYTNRAYVKKMQGNIEGACEDLYEALGLGIEGSQTFIEKQIDNNCL